MSFNVETRRALRQSYNFRCSICNDFHAPRGIRYRILDAHSVTGKHINGSLEDGLTACTSQMRDSCHQRIHRLIDEVGREKGAEIVQEAAQLAGLDLAFELLRRGVSEKNIRRILNTRPL